MTTRTLVLTLALSVAIGLTTAAAATAANAGDAKTTYRTVAGDWISDGCLPAGDGGSTASLAIDRRAFTLEVPIYADRQCTTKLFTIAVGGTYQLRGRSADVQGARTARFSFGARRVTPHAQFIADAMNEAQCGRTVSRVGFATDVLETGCAPVGQKSREDCPAEYELVKRTAGRLFLGERPADGQGLCSPDRQATALGSGLVRG